MSDIEQTILDSIADLPESDASQTAADDATTETTTKTTAAATETTAEGATEAADAITAQPGEEQPKKRGSLPLHRHESILANTRKEYDAKISELTTKLQGFDSTEYQTQRTFMQLVESDPARALEILKTVDPRYGELIGQRQEAKQPAQTEDLGDGMPEPDVVGADGSFQYSQKGLAKLLQWNSQQTEKRLMGQLDPMLQEHRQRERVRAVVPKLQAQLDAAAQWPGFTDSQDDILKALKADKTLSLESAYMKVVLPKLQTNRDAMRAELLNELNQKPKAVSGTTPSAAPAATDDGDIESVIRRSIAGIR